MRKSRFNEEQIVTILKEVDAGVPVGELCRRLGVSEGTFYRWKTKYGGLEQNEARRLKALEEENGRLKKIVARSKGNEEAGAGIDVEPADRHSVKTGVPHFLDPDDR